MSPSLEGLSLPPRESVIYRDVCLGAVCPWIAAITADGLFVTERRLPAEATSHPRGPGRQKHVCGSRVNMGAPPHLTTVQVQWKSDTRPRRGGTASAQPQACSLCLKFYALHSETRRLTRKPVTVS